MAATISYLIQVPEGVVPAVRIPMCAAYWMDVCSADDGCDWADAAATYPDLSGQYRSLIKNLVSEW